ncbi:MAG: ATP-binding protein, partial [Planctomycetota bacterium]
MDRLPPLPTWATDLVTNYESGAASQFILAGNVGDRLVLPIAEGRFGSLSEFLLKVLLPRFDVVLTYDLGNGLRVEKGGEIFARWPRMKENPTMPRQPRESVEFLSHYLRYCANLARLGLDRIQVGVILKTADLVIPNIPGAGYDLTSIASLIRDWASDGAFADQPVATFLIADNLADLHPLVANNPRACLVRVPLPAANDLERALNLAAPKHPTALGGFKADLARPAGMLAGTTLSAIESLLKTREHQKLPLTDADLMGMKKTLVERDCAGLIEFIDSRRTLEDYAAGDRLKTQIRQDISLWRAGDLQALPMGYLLCGPVGTGKTYLVECLAGEASVPVIKLKNFRDKWVGSTEGNLEKIFRLIHALGRTIVFIDEADQTLGQRTGGGDDSGIGGRVYSMIAQEMSNG